MENDSGTPFWPRLRSAIANDPYIVWLCLIVLLVAGFTYLVSIWL